MNSENKQCALSITSKRWNTVRTGICLLLLTLSFTSCHSAAPVPPSPLPNKDWAITETFTFDFTNFSKCSATVTKGCVSGFTFGYSQGGTQVQLKTSPVSICAGATQPQTCTDSVNSVLGIGPTLFYVTANGIDNGGLSVTSAANNSAIDDVKLISPAGITVTRN